MEKKKRFSFFRDAIASIKDFDEYENFAIAKLGKSIQYFLGIIVIFVLVIVGCYTYKIAKVTEEGIHYIAEEMPEFTYQNKELNIEQESPIFLENEDTIPGIIILDTKANEQQVEEYTKNIGLYDNGIVFLKDRVLVKNVATSTINTLLYEQIATNYNIGDFTRTNLVEWIQNLNKIEIYSALFLAIFLYFFLIYGLSTLVDVVMLGALGYVTARIIGVRIKYKGSFNMAVHAVTLPILLNMIYIVVNLLTGFVIRYFDIMYTTISYIYMVTAIIIIRTNLMRRQIEITKLEQEQQKIREELQRQEEEKKKEEMEEEPKEEKEDKKEKQDDRKYWE